MADNYLERKMEDLQRGGSRSSISHHPQGNLSNRIIFTFPTRRILILDGFTPTGLNIAIKLSSIGSKVAIMGKCCNPTQVEIKDRCLKSGIRTITLDNSDIASLSAQLLQAWRSVEIILSFGSELEESVESEISRLLQIKPAPTDYMRRSITLRDVTGIKGIACQKCDKTKSGSIFRHLTLLYNSSSPNSEEQLKRKILYLLLPESIDFFSK